MYHIVDSSKGADFIANEQTNKHTTFILVVFSNINTWYILGVEILSFFLVINQSINQSIKTHLYSHNVASESKAHAGLDKGECLRSLYAVSNSSVFRACRKLLKD